MNGEAPSINRICSTRPIGLEFEECSFFLGFADFHSVQEASSKLGWSGSLGYKCFTLSYDVQDEQTQN